MNYKGFGEKTTKLTIRPFNAVNQDRILGYREIQQCMQHFVMLGHKLIVLAAFVPLAVSQDRILGYREIQQYQMGWR